MKATIVQVDGTQEIDGRDVDYDAEVRVVYAPAKLSGPPEDCYPDESEAEIVRLTTFPEGFEGRLDWDLIEEKAWEQFINDRGQQ